MVFRATAIICASLTVATVASAANYYVAPTGQDSNPGTQASPWQTIQKAADTLTPGDTVFVRTGAYSKVSVNVSGSAGGGWIKFVNYPGEKPVIDAAGAMPAANETALFLLANRSYVAIQGFELRNYKTTQTSLISAELRLHQSPASRPGN